MADRKIQLDEDATTETAEMAYSRIVRRKLIERGYRQDQIEAKTADLLRRGIDLDPRSLNQS